MKTAGQILKEARQKKHKTLRDIAKRTKIKERFLQALEDDDFANLPDLPIALGFTKSYASVLGADSDLVAALVRRDFPQAQPAPKAEESALIPTSFWTPQTTLFAVGILAAAILGAYLLRQYLLFAAPPPIKVEHLRKVDSQLELVGKTNPQATVEVNGVQVLVDDSGTFTFTGDLPENGAVEIKATSRTGKQTTLQKRID